MGVRYKFTITDQDGNKFIKVCRDMCQGEKFQREILQKSILDNKKLKSFEISSYFKKCK